MVLSVASFLRGQLTHLRNYIAHESHFDWSTEQLEQNKKCTSSWPSSSIFLVFLSLNLANFKLFLHCEIQKFPSHSEY